MRDSRNFFLNFSICHVSFSLRLIVVCKLSFFDFSTSTGIKIIFFSLGWDARTIRWRELNNFFFIIVECWRRNCLFLIPLLSEELSTDSAAVRSQHENLFSPFRHSHFTSCWAKVCAEVKIFGERWERTFNISCHLFFITAKLGDFFELLRAFFTVWWCFD